MINIFVLFDWKILLLRVLKWLKKSARNPGEIAPLDLAHRETSISGVSPKIGARYQPFRYPPPKNSVFCAKPHTAPHTRVIGPRYKGHANKEEFRDG